MSRLCEASVDMKAIILAAGSGTRCYPLTYLYPKIFQQVGGIPILEYMLSWFSGMPEIEKLYLVMNKAGVESIERYMKNRNSYLPKISRLFSLLGYKVECRNPNFVIEVIEAGGRGTGGDLRLALDTITAKDILGEDFIVCNGDYITIRRVADGALSPQINLAGIVRHHRMCKQELQTVMTVSLVPVKKEDARRFGVAHVQQVNNFHIIENFVEKPDKDGIRQKPLVNAGIYIIDRDFILPRLDKYLPDKDGTTLERTLIGQLVSEAKPRLAAYFLDLHRWFDIGTLEQLVEANICIALERSEANQSRRTKIRSFS